MRMRSVRATSASERTRASAFWIGQLGNDLRHRAEATRRPNPRPRPQIQTRAPRRRLCHGNSGDRFGRHGSCIATHDRRRGILHPSPTQHRHRHVQLALIGNSLTRVAGSRQAALQGWLGMRIPPLTFPLAFHPPPPVAYGPPQVGPVGGVAQLSRGCPSYQSGRILPQLSIWQKRRHGRPPRSVSALPGRVGARPP